MKYYQTMKDAIKELETKQVEMAEQLCPLLRASCSPAGEIEIRFIK